MPRGLALRVVPCRYFPLRLQPKLDRPDPASGLLKPFVPVSLARARWASRMNSAIRFLPTKASMRRSVSCAHIQRVSYAGAHIHNAFPENGKNFRLRLQRIPATKKCDAMRVLRKLPHVLGHDRCT
jgi:hypothetical protein